MDEMEKLIREADEAAKRKPTPKKDTKESEPPPPTPPQAKAYSKNLKPCKSCGNLNDKSAAVCPSCGKKLKSTSSLLKIILVIIIIGVFSMIFAVVSNVGNAPTEEKSELQKAVDRQVKVYSVAQVFVSDLLKAPSTAKFPPYDASFVTRFTEIHGEAYRVRSYVDSQNSFGAMIRTWYTCDISYNKENKNNEWGLLNVSFDK